MTTTNDTDFFGHSKTELQTLDNYESGRVNAVLDVKERLVTDRAKADAYIADILADVDLSNRDDAAGALGYIEAMEIEFP